MSALARGGGRLVRWGLLLGLSAQVAHGQARITISGTVKDATTGEDLTGASVHLAELPGVGRRPTPTAFTRLLCRPVPIP
ncbi:DUF3869 domain-containing protein [Hymenobacter sp. BRD67]|uniref:DUF3869 domain-containing protein n=1 Tax=Hymenobacter sp. BRD67 TaxID=2675877 RepID=UPI0020B64C2F|nr:DUF3869 domain-containing protein [Hymenobacter sp. BRD67]